MGRLSDLSTNPVITEYAQGAAQSMIQPVADFLAPPVEVSKQVGKYKVYDEKSRFHIADTKRALGGRATELRFDVSDATYDCTPHSIDVPIDNLEELEHEGLESAFQEGAIAAAEQAALSHESDVISAALTSVGAGTDLNAAEASTVDLVDKIDEQILEILKVAKYGSLMGIGVLFGASAFRRFKNHNKVRARFNAGKRSSQLITPTIDDAMGLLLGNPEARISYCVKDANGPGEAESTSFLMDEAVLIFARLASPTRRDPSFMKTFRLRGNWMVPGSYTRDDERVQVAKFDWSEDVVVTNSSACARLNFNAS